LDGALAPAPASAAAPAPAATAGVELVALLVQVLLGLCLDLDRLRQRLRLYRTTTAPGTSGTGGLLGGLLLDAGGLGPRGRLGRRLDRGGRTGGAGRGPRSAGRTGLGLGCRLDRFGRDEDRRQRSGPPTGTLLGGRRLLGSGCRSRGGRLLRRRGRGGLAPAPGRLGRSRRGGLGGLGDRWRRFGD